MLTCDNIFFYGMSVFMNLISEDNLIIFLPHPLLPWNHPSPSGTSPDM